MTDQWERVAAVFEAAADHEASERPAFVATACAGEPALLRQVEALLTAADAAGESLIVDRPVEELIVNLLGEEAADVIGVQVGAYRVEALLGTGGMGEVYRASDTVLGRQVAIKVLPRGLAADPERLARFKREAQILASLNHPGIGAIYGLETWSTPSGPTLGLVLELVPGATLAEQLAAAGGRRQGGADARGLPVEDALAVARQIAQALEAAHELGIVHRDLKPANIKVRDDGTVKVLDFGLARVLDVNGGESSEVRPTVATVSAVSTAGPTHISPAVTAAGTLLGTAAYMSPEQATGRTADKRSDIWAFGCVLYEMLTGTRAFAGDQVADVLSAILASEPDWHRLPPALSPTVVTYIKRCLHKDPRGRIGDVQSLRLALDGVFDAGLFPPADPPRPGRWRVAGLIGAAALAAVTAIVVFVNGRSPTAVRPQVSRLQIAPVDAAALTVSADGYMIATTPDGSHLVYVGDGGRQLFVRPFDVLEAVSIFTGAPHAPFVSPDGQWVGFFENGSLRKVPLAGGPAVTLAALDGPVNRGGSWGTDGTIVFATSNPTTGLQRVAASGGPVTILTRPDSTKGEAEHSWPEWLPGGHVVLFTVAGARAAVDAEAMQVVALDVQSGSRSTLVRGGSHARYVPSGHLVYATPGALRAVAFDLAQLTTRGTPIAVVKDVVTTDQGAVDAVVAGNGTLTYVAGGPLTQSTRVLVWVDRQGRETPIPAPPRAYTLPRLSPDATRLAVFTADQEADLWLWDLRRTTLTRFTSGAGVDTHPLWTTDSTRLIFSSQRSGVLNLFWQSADGATPVARLTESPNPQRATSMSPDGRTLIFTEATPATGDDVMQLPVDAPGHATPLVQSAFAERNGTVSPDGRWLAYEANDSGRFEIFIQPYPNLTDGRWQVSMEGGVRPLWTRDSRELVWVDPGGGLTRAGIEPRQSSPVTRPTPVLQAGYFTSPVNPDRTFDVSSDGKRFLMIKEGNSVRRSGSGNFIVVLNWLDELRRLVPSE